MVQEDALQEMVSEIHKCPIDDFLNHYLPFVPTQESIDSAFQRFTHGRLPMEVNNSDQNGDQRALAWDAFVPNSVNPEATEETVFGPLQNIADFLVTVKCRNRGAKKNAKPRTCKFSYRDCPATEVQSEIPGTNFWVDACITANPDSEQVILSDTAVIAEYKKGTDVAAIMDVSACASSFTLYPELTNVYQNHYNLVSAASHIMNADPCRTWVYGVRLHPRTF